MTLRGITLFLIALTMILPLYGEESSNTIIEIVKARCGETNSLVIIYYRHTLHNALELMLVGFMSQYLNLSDLKLCRVFLKNLDVVRGLNLNTSTMPLLALYLPKASKDIVKKIERFIHPVGDLYIVDVPMSILTGCRYGIIMDVYREPSLENAISIGSRSANIKIFIYEDLWCPFCAKFYVETLPKLRELIDRGAVEFIHKNLVVHDEVFPQHILLESAFLQFRDSEGIISIVDEYYKQYHKTHEPPSMDYLEELIKKKFGTIPNVEKFRDEARKIILHDIDESHRYGICGTPGFVIWSSEKDIGIAFSGFVTFEELKDLIENLTETEIATASMKGGMLTTLGPLFIAITAIAVVVVVLVLKFRR